LRRRPARPAAARIARRHVGFDRAPRRRVRGRRATGLRRQPRVLAVDCGDWPNGDFLDLCRRLRNPDRVCRALGAGDARSELRRDRRRSAQALERRERSATSPPRKAEVAGISHRTIAAVAIAVVVVAFIALHRDETRISFIVFEKRTAPWIALTLAAASGFVAGF
jgi:hypothetical protein